MIFDDKNMRREAARLAAAYNGDYGAIQRDARNAARLKGDIVSVSELLDKQAKRKEPELQDSGA